MYVDGFNMDLSHIWSKICYIFFLPPGIVISICGFLAISNAFVLRYSLDWRNKCANYTVPNSQDLKILNLNFKIFQRKSFCHEEYRSNSLEGEKCHGNSNRDYGERCCGNIDSQQLRILMMLSFYVGYTLSHFPAIVMVERYGGKWISVIYLTLTGILTVSTPHVIQFYGIRGFTCIRLLMGFSEGPLLPALNNFSSQQIRRHRHCGSLEGSLLFNASHIGILIINLLSALLVPHMECKIISYFLASCTGLWFICFLAFVLYDSESNKQYGDVEPSATQHNIEPVNSSSYQLSNNFETWNHLWYNPTMLTLISAVIQHEWTQSLIITEVHRLMDDLRDSSIWNNYDTCWKMLIPLLMSWVIAGLTELLANIMVMCNILTTTEAMNLRSVIASFGPKICSDFVTCLMSTEGNNVITAFNCAIGVLSSYYMGSKINSLDINTPYAGALMNLANDIGSILTIMAPYMELLARQEGPLENVRSLIWFMCTLFSSEIIQPIDEPVIHAEAIYRI